MLPQLGDPDEWVKPAGAENQPVSTARLFGILIALLLTQFAPGHIRSAPTSDDDRLKLSARDHQDIERELSELTKRLELLRGKETQQRNSGDHIADAEIFAKNLHRQKILDDRDFGVYRTLYESLRDSLRPPDLLVALTCSLKATKRRIATRGRAMEAEIPDAYLRRLHKLYEEWFESYTLSPVVRIDTTELDYVENLVDLIELQNTIDRALG